MAPEVERADPPYVQIARRIRADIESGALAEGDRVPSAREITSMWGVALATATKVHARLRNDGLIRALPGVGSVVAARERARGGTQRLQSTHARGLIYGVNEAAEVLASEVVEAPDHVRAALDLRGDLAIRRERVTRRGDQPISWSVSWLPADHIGLAPLLLSTERIKQGTFGYLASVLGVEVVSGRDETAAGNASVEQASALGVSPQAPVLLTRTWYFIADGTSIEYGESVHPAGRWLSHDFKI